MPGPWSRHRDLLSESQVRRRLKAVDAPEVRGCYIIWGLNEACNIYIYALAIWG